MSTKVNKDPLEKVTADTYVCPKGEEKRYHVKMEIVRYDPSTGEKSSRARIMKFGLKTFKSLATAMKKQGYTMTILHDPLAEVAEGPKAEGPKKTRKKTEKAPETEAPETEAPETEAPEVETPETETEE